MKYTSLHLAIVLTPPLLAMVLIAFVKFHKSDTFAKENLQTYWEKMI